MGVPIGDTVKAVVDAALFVYHGVCLIRAQQIRDSDKPVVWEKPYC